MTMKVTVDWNLCRGHALCRGYAPEVFELDDDEDRSYVKVDSIPESQADAVRQAALGCPEEAIVVEEAPAPARA
jgi:ferredoxin